MIRYRPDWDRAAHTPTDPDEAASNLLEPMLKELASRLGPDKAAEAINKALLSAGLAPELPADTDESDPSPSEDKS